jgi:hypothetical protein
MSVLRIYGVDMEYVSGPLTKEAFMNLAEELGYVWTIEGFEDEFNSGFMNDNMIIQFIDLEDGKF